MSNKHNMREIPEGEGQLFILCYECDYYGFSSSEEICPRCSSIEKWYHRTPPIAICCGRCIRCDPYGDLARARKELMKNE